MWLYLDNYKNIGSIMIISFLCRNYRQDGVIARGLERICIVSTIRKEMDLSRYLFVTSKESDLAG